MACDKFHGIHFAKSPDNRKENISSFHWNRPKAQNTKNNKSNSEFSVVFFPISDLPLHDEGCFFSRRVSMMKDFLVAIFDHSLFLLSLLSVNCEMFKVALLFTEKSASS